jgi:hypothetical protein
LLLALCLVLSGCAHIRTDLGAPLPPETALAQAGPSHYSTVLEAYGPPSKISALPAGFVFLYEHVQIDERQWGLILPGPIAKYFKIVWATSRAETNLAVFVFDQQGRLSASDFETFRNDPGGGFGLTLIFKIKSLTETYEYTRSQEGILDWGMAALQRLPVTLNAAQSLDAGDQGLDVLRVDGVAGQRALELDQPK